VIIFLDPVSLARLHMLYVTSGRILNSLYPVFRVRTCPKDPMLAGCCFSLFPMRLRYLGAPIDPTESVTVWILLYGALVCVRLSGRDSTLNRLHSVWVDLRLASWLMAGRSVILFLPTLNQSAKGRMMGSAIPGIYQKACKDGRAMLKSNGGVGYDWGACSTQPGVGPQ